MKIHSTVYTVIVLLILIGIAGLLVWGTDRIEGQTFDAIRVGQIQSAGTDSGVKYEPLRTIGDLVVPDFFEEHDSQFRYWGGVYGGPWEVGQTYSREELSASFDSHQVGLGFYAHKWGSNDFYVNVDRGDETAVRDFLKTLDGMSGSDIDTLILDFRFLRAIDFGAILRLFNQIAPTRKIRLGTIVNAYQEEEIISSGRPFFTANQTIFLVDEKIPDPVKHLTSNLCRIAQYHLRGNLGTVPDSVCLTTQYEIDEKKYRVCSEKWTSASGEFDLPASYKTFPDSVRIRSMAQMDVVWYKNRDTAAMEEMVNRLVTLL